MYMQVRTSYFASYSDSIEDRQEIKFSRRKLAMAYTVSVEPKCWNRTVPKKGCPDLAIHLTLWVLTLLKERSQMHKTPKKYQKLHMDTLLHIAEIKGKKM